MSEIPENQTQNLEIAFPTESDPDIDDPWADDSLDRKILANQLTTIVNCAGMKNSLTISVHGEWGTGKTFMLKRWAIDMEETHNVIYFNAWENDFINDPIIAIIGQIAEKLKDKKLKEIGNSITEGLIPASVKILNVAGLEKSDLQSSLEKSVDKYIEVSKKSEDLKKRLSEIAKKRPVLFIVDELDRCLPTFAVKTLERIKHLFSVPGIVFVFGVNKISLKESIIKVYGNIDSDDYLRRFFHLDLNLPQADPVKFSNTILRKYGIYKFLSNNKSFMSGIREDRGTPYWLFTSMLYLMNMNLREVEYSIRLFRLALVHEKNKSTSGYRQDISWLVFSLIILKIKDHELYSKIINKECTCKEAIDGFLQIFPSTILSDDDTKKLTLCQETIEEELYFLMYDEEIGAALRRLSGNKTEEKDSSLLAKITLKRSSSRDYDILERFNQDHGGRLIQLKTITDLLDLADNSLR